MAYKLKCNDCGKVFTASSRNAYCPTYHQRDYRGVEFLGEVLDTAIDVAAAVTVAHVTGDIIGGAADVVGSLFDW